MTASKKNRHRIARIGGPGRSWIELRGSVLVFHDSCWTWTQSAFVPVEWVEVSRDNATMAAPWIRIAGLLVCMMGVASLSARYILGYLGGAAIDSSMNQAANVLVIVATAALLVLSRWTRRTRERVWITVESEPNSWDCVFWHRPEDDPELEELVEKLECVEDDSRERLPYAAHLSYTTQRVRPVRMVVARTALMTGALALPTAGLAWWLGMPALLGFLALPGTVYSARFLLARLRWRLAPKAMRDAVTCMDGNRFGEALEHLRRLRERLPHSVEAAAMAVHAHMRSNQFEKALAECRVVAKLDPDTADMLTEEVWGYRRIQERMEVEL